MEVGLPLIVTVAACGAAATVAFAVIAWQWERRRLPEQVVAERICPACRHPLTTAYARECPHCGRPTRYGRMTRTGSVQWEFAALSLAGAALLIVGFLGRSPDVAGRAASGSDGRDTFLDWVRWLADTGLFWAAGAAVVVIALFAMFRKQE